MPRRLLLSTCLSVLCLSACKEATLFVLDPSTSQRVQIVLPADAGTNQQRAAEVLREHLAMMLPTEPDVGAARADADIHILLDPPDSDVDRVALGPDGFHLAVAGNEATIVGGSEKGTIYGAYALLEDLGFRLWTPGALHVPPSRRIQLAEGARTEIPSIEFREAFYTPAWDPAFQEWHRLDRHIEEWGLWVHTFERLVPPDEHFEAHPEWFAEVNGKRIPNGQLCLTNDGVFHELVARLREQIEAEPGKHYWSVSQNDTFGNCTCDACAAIDEREGAHSGSLIAFTNRVAEQFPDKTISTLAYQYSRKAPAHLRPAPNVLIVLAPIELNRSRPVATDPSAAGFRAELEDWARVTDRVLLWDYVIQFANLVSPFPNLRVLQPNLRYFVEQHAVAHFQQGNREVGGEWAELRTWVISRLLWNPDLDAEVLIDEFLAGYYGAAAPHLRAYVDTQHDALAASGAGLDIFGNPIGAAKTYLTPELLTTYEAQFDRAEAAVAGDATLAQRVRWARLPLYYARLEQAKTRATGDLGLFEREGEGWRPRPAILEQLDHFVDTAQEQGVTRVTEWHTTPEEYRQRYREVLQRVPLDHLAVGREPSFTTPFSPKYPADGAATLTDGLRGPVDHRYGWIGWEGEHMEAVVDLGEPQALRRVRADFLHDVGSWIFLPLAVEVEVSNDGEQWQAAGRTEVTTDERAGGVRTESFAVDTTATARYVRVRAISPRTCPDWHGGAGGKAWIFADEIVVEGA
jgi:hypothetical protein